MATEGFWIPFSFPKTVVSPGLHRFIGNLSFQVLPKSKTRASGVRVFGAGELTDTIPLRRLGLLANVVQDFPVNGVLGTETHQPFGQRQGVGELLALLVEQYQT